ncbi:MAG: hypothetical protein GC185_12220 [Alphaproteobacteria bacterium]|nr:hypothetical protein [Alphaproteobacteria bacterium]
MDIQEKTDKALDALRNAKAKSFLNDGASEEVIKITNLVLNKYHFADMPADYAHLLLGANGIMGPYFTLLGLGPMETANGGLTSYIVAETREFNKFADEDDDKPLVLGNVSGGALLIHHDGKYRLIDESSYDEFNVYDDIADFITGMIEMKDKARAATS